jgi:nucleotide-binding universal stress UspA family protein
VVEIPFHLPLDADLPEQEAEAERLLDDAQAFLEEYGLRPVTRLIRARSAGAELVAEAERRNAELVVVGATRRRGRSGEPIFGPTVDRLLRESPARVLLAAAEKAA